MKHPNAGPVIAIGIVALLGTACGRDRRAAQLAALEDALRSGILTPAEYQAKKAALVAPAQMAALDDAYKSGVLTRAEYDAKRAALIGAAAPPPATPAPVAPAPAMPAQIAPQTPRPPVPATIVPPTPPPARAAATPPPATRVAALPAAMIMPASAPAPSAAMSASHAGYLIMKKAVVFDQYGYDHPMPTLSMLVPTDWQVQGATTWNAKDQCNTIATHLVAAGPDGSGFEVFPHYAWSWADNPGFLQQDAQQKARMGTKACDVMPAMGAADFIRRNLPRYRPNAQIVGLEPMPKLMQAMQAQARQTEQQGRQYGVQQQVRSDVVRARLRYNLNGRPVEEWFVAITTSTGIRGPLGATYNCGAVTFAERAPQGKLDASEKFYDMLVASMRVNPEWQARVNGTNANVFNSEHREIQKRVAINTQTANDLDNIRQQGWNYKQRSEDHVFGQASQATLGVQTYRNPATGETWDFSNTYSHAWVNDRNEFVLTDQEGFDPNTAVRGNWHALEQVRQ